MRASEPLTLALAGVNAVKVVDSNACAPVS